MSIVVSVKVRDGLVLGADSASQIYLRVPEGRVGVAKAYTNAKKLFQVSNLPIGVLSYGAGNIGNKSPEGLMFEFGRVVGGLTPEERESVQRIANKLLDFLRDEYERHFKDIPETEKPLLGIYVGGYSKDDPFAEEWEFQLPKDPECRLVRAKEAYGASWRGVSLPFTRLHMGFDPRVRDRLKELGVDDETIKKALEGWQSPVAYDGMPVQDAVNFAHYILKTTVSYATFELGPPSCGGPLDIAAILPSGKFEWVTQRPLAVQD